jgi:DNA invertase Pin-like site-specific DNA recombinase
MPKLFGYVRASTNTQELTGEEQRKRINQHFQAVLIKVPALEWGDCYEDKATSSSKRLANRKAGAELLLALRQGDHLVVASFDRAFRNLPEAIAHLERWFDDGVQVHVLDCPFLDTSHWMGRAIMQLLAWVAEFERRMIRERTRIAVNSDKVKAKKAARMAKGWFTNATYGFRLIGAKGHKRAVVDVEERKVMALIVELRDLERLSWEEIAIRLMRQRIVTKYGKCWLKGRCRSAYFAELALRGKTNGHVQELRNGAALGQDGNGQEDAPGRQA